VVDQCDNCKFYRSRVYSAVPPVPTPPDYVAPPPKTVYECRFSDPFVQGQRGYWPEVKPDDWCGKWAAIPVAQEVRMLGEIPP
jgi:hypothetical protein